MWRDVQRVGEAECVQNVKVDIFHRRDRWAEVSSDSSGHHSTHEPRTTPFRHSHFPSFWSRLHQPSNLSQTSLVFDLWWFLKTLWPYLCPQFFRPLTSYPSLQTWSHTCWSPWSKQDCQINTTRIHLARTPQLCQEILQVLYCLYASQTSTA